MKKLNIALLQIAPCSSLEENLNKGVEYCKKAKEQNADIALFPEMWSCGYDIYERPFEEWRKDAIKRDCEFISAFQTLSKDLEMAIGITFLEEFHPSPRNSFILFDKNGKECLFYSKVHTCDFGEEQNLTPGNDFYVNTLETCAGEVQVGAMICYDREFPESARILMLKGAELILVPNACPMEINRLSQLRGRAFENMTAIATCNYPSSVPDCNGNSTVFDSIAYLPQLSGSRDTCIIRADENEGIFIGALDLDTLREYRASEVHGNAYRRPEKYTQIISKEVSAPFIRQDAKR